MSYPYPDPMSMLSALVWTLGAEVHRLSGRFETTVTGAWSPSTPPNTYVLLPVKSTLGAPSTGRVRVGSSVYTYLATDPTTFYLDIDGPLLPPSVGAPIGARVTLEVTT